MINVYKEMIVETLQASSLNAVALKKDGRVITSVYTLRLDDAVCEWELLIDARDPITEYRIDLLAHASQNFAARKRGTNRVTICASV
jgi:hypothetical protein